MRSALHLLARCRDDTHSPVYFAEGARHATRPFKRRHQVADRNLFDWPTTAVRHPHQGASRHAFVIVVDALLFFFVALVLHPGELDNALNTVLVLERPAGSLAAVSVPMADITRDVLHELAGRRLLLANNETPLGLGHGDARNQRGFPASSSPTIPHDVRNAFIRIHLRPRCGVEQPIVSVDQRVELGALGWRHLEAQSPYVVRTVLHGQPR